MHDGRMDSELDKFFAYSDDAWEQTARVLAMTHALIVTVSNMLGGKLTFEGPDHFNASLSPPTDSPAAIDDDYPWAPEEDANNGQQK